jgi:hypothetical protein
MPLEESLKQVLEYNTENNIILYYSVGSLTLFTSIPRDNPNCTELSKQFYDHVKWQQSNH